MQEVPLIFNLRSTKRLQFRVKCVTSPNLLMIHDKSNDNVFALLEMSPQLLQHEPQN